MFESLNPFSRKGDKDPEKDSEEKPMNGIDIATHKESYKGRVLDGKIATASAYGDGVYVNRLHEDESKSVAPLQDKVGLEDFPHPVIKKGNRHDQKITETEDRPHAKNPLVYDPQGELDKYRANMKAKNVKPKNKYRPYKK